MQAQSGKQDKARKLKTYQVWYRFKKAIDVNWDMVLKPLKINKLGLATWKQKQHYVQFSLKKMYSLVKKNIATICTN